MNLWLGTDTVEGAMVGTIEVIGLLLTMLTFNCETSLPKKSPF